MTQATEFEDQLSGLLLEGKKEEAKALLMSSSTSKDKETGETTYPDLEGLTRMARSRAIVLLEGKATQVEQEAMAPKYLRMTSPALLTTLIQHVESYKASGAAAEQPKRVKAKPRGIKGMNKPDAETEEPTEAKKPEKAKEPETEKSEAVAPKKKRRGRPPGAKDKQPRKRRGIQAGSVPTAAPTEDPPPKKETEGVKKKRAPVRRKRKDAEPTKEDKPKVETAPEPEKAQEAPVEPEAAPAVELPEGDLKDLLEQVLINVNALKTAVGQKKDQLHNIRQSLDNVDAIMRRTELLYKQNGYLATAIHLLASEMTDSTPDEFHERVVRYMEQLGEENKDQAEGEEDAAESGTKS